MTRNYKALLAKGMRFPSSRSLAQLDFFALSIVGLRYVPQQFFPSSDRTEILVDLTLPQNSSIRASEGIAKKLDEVLAADADVARWSTYVGRGAIRFYLPLNVQMPNEFFASRLLSRRISPDVNV